MLLLCLQKLNDVRSKLQPGAISNVKVNVGDPPELLNAIARPEAPTKLVQFPVLVFHEELERFGSMVPGATLYGLPEIAVVPKLCRYTWELRLKLKEIVISKKI